ncbi:MAG: hypothetical protein K2Y56_00140 [Methylobacterium sp.]|uniref:hypothetical protein n=1 Tax=Methylobacterium sp. TaxID=409 RepID=UPI0025DF3169|nr:hypothetical protein [Methylobacterium sp.]MBX9929948.1 hypothetical protein [Methylobacterium sp.]
MRLPLLVASFLISTSAAFAQTPAPPAPDAKSSDQPAAKPEGAPHSTTGNVGQPLETGSNSFTEGQVKERFSKMGFGEVKDLRKDDSGIWRGTAQHAGKAVTIGMDYKGNVAAQ